MNDHQTVPIEEVEDLTPAQEVSARIGGWIVRLHGRLAAEFARSVLGPDSELVAHLTTAIRNLEALRALYEVPPAPPTPREDPSFDRVWNAIQRAGGSPQMADAVIADLGSAS